MATLKIGFYDLVWYSAESKRIVGDMGFTFNDSADTRFPADELKENISTALQYHNRESYEGEVGNGIDSDFAIYEVHTAEGLIDDENENLWSAEIDIDTDNVVALLVCATKSDAQDIIRKRYGDDLKAVYYIED